MFVKFFIVVVVFVFVVVLLFVVYVGDCEFFDSIVGVWQGLGEIVVGKYKGMKFICDFKGEFKFIGVGFKFDGLCCVGVFVQLMFVMIECSGESYKGLFFDGFDGKGFDIVFGVVVGNCVIVGINCKNLNGVMIVCFKDKNMFNVMIFVCVNDSFVFVIGMMFDCKMDQVLVGLIKQVD